MSVSALDIGIVTDEITRDLAAALDHARQWGVGRFELREGGKARFPGFTSAEKSLVDAAVGDGNVITAVSPGVFKQSAADEATTRSQLDDVLPRSIELAQRYGCPLLIVFGFERLPADGPRERLLALRAFERAAELAAGADMTIAIENEPEFWVDDASGSVAIVEEVGHPALKLNWDPANRIWGGGEVREEDFAIITPHLANLHVKDYDPSNPAAPWVPVGDGTIGWEEILDWVVTAGVLGHVTLETHCASGVEASRKSLAKLREWLHDD